MKILKISLSAILLNTFVLNMDANQLPDLGSGDCKLITATDGRAPISFFIGKYNGEAVNLTANNVDTRNAGSFDVLYSSSDKQAWIAAEITLNPWRFYHIYPLMEKRGFFREVISAPGWISGKFVDARTQLILLTEDGGRINTIPVDEDLIRKQMNLQEDDLFLGQLDGIVFYWKHLDPERIYARDAKQGKGYKWKINGLIEVKGVVRGTKSDYGFTAWRRTFSFCTQTPIDETIVDVSLERAERF